jgi:hypothetical protein
MNQGPKKNTPRKRPNKPRSEKTLKSIIDQLNTADRSVTDPKMLASVLEEYLSSYIIIGYNTEGEPVSFTKANSSIEIDALNTSLHRFLTTYGMFGLGPTPPDEPKDVEDL